MPSPFECPVRGNPSDAPRRAARCRRSPGLHAVIAARKHAASAADLRDGFSVSVHNYTLRYWLAATGIHPDRDLRIIVVPPRAWSTR